MKLTDKKKPVPTIPEGVWEGSRPNPEESPLNQKDGTSNAATDLQKNGYPTDKRVDDI